jgi:hypothetical protein
MNHSQTAALIGLIAVVIVGTICVGAGVMSLISFVKKQVQLDTIRGE